jgi:hypothetical protein
MSSAPTRFGTMYAGRVPIRRRILDRQRGEYSKQEARDRVGGSRPMFSGTSTLNRDTAVEPPDTYNKQGRKQTNKQTSKRESKQAS